MVQSEIQLHNNFGVTDWLWSSPIPKRCSHCAEFFAILVYTTVQNCVKISSHHLFLYILLPGSQPFF